MNRQQRRANQAMSASRPPKEPTSDETGLVVSLFKQGRFVDAEVIARKITERFPDVGFGWKCLGTLLKSQSRSEESLDALEKAARLLPDDYEVHSNHSVAYKNLNRIQAEKFYEL